MRYETRWFDAHLRSAVNLSPEVRQLEIVPQGGAVPYTPGSHINVGVMAGKANSLSPDIRSYSLVGEAPVKGAYRIAVRRQPEGRGGSLYMWSLDAGERLRVSNPQNLFEMGFGKPQYLLLAGGIGITPILGMAFALDRAGADFRLLYAGRSSAGMPFVPELRERLGERLRLFTSEGGTRPDLPVEISALHPEAELYMCGPAGLMDAVRHQWKRAGRPPANLRFETFGSSGCSAAEPFYVKIADREMEVAVPENQTMLQALRDAGVEIMFDCLRGECGLCAVKVLEIHGILDHRDVFLSDEEKLEGGRICTCVSRVVTGNITVDTGYRNVPVPFRPANN